MGTMWWLCLSRPCSTTTVGRSFWAAVLAFAVPATLPGVLLAQSAVVGIAEATVAILSCRSIKVAADAHPRGIHSYHIFQYVA